MKMNARLRGMTNIACMRRRSNSEPTDIENPTNPTINSCLAISNNLPSKIGSGRGTDSFGRLVS
jgi:hypothetical protein